MNYRLISLSAAVLSSVLGGCAISPAYRCPIDGSKPDDGARCSSVSQAYKAGVRNPGAEYSVFDERSPGATAPVPGAAGFALGRANPLATAEQGAPVFQQPRVLRPYLAPYVDAQGNLRSGEYGYFSTPGSWNYGTSRKAGQASDLFAPARPDNLGFTPSAAPAAARPAAPPVTGAPATSGATGASSAQSPAGASSAGGGAPGAVAPAAPARVDGITQPYQRLAQP